uniref:Chromosome 16 open reading frame 87 n=1 Tax=Zosterops lateralis melanops TaxID=1220523 RepID=A0A8D2PQB2_ZOSLA
HKVVQQFRNLISQFCQHVGTNRAPGCQLSQGQQDASKLPGVLSRNTLKSASLSPSKVPVACKSCPCGYIFISRKLLHAKRAERSPPITENKSEAKRRRTERVKREKINSAVNKDLENRKRSRSNSHSDHSRRGRGRPKSASAKKHEEEREKQEKEVDMYANLSDEKAFVFSVALAEINRKIINQRLIL